MARRGAVIIKWDKSERERFKELIREAKKQSPALANKITNDVESNLNT